MTFAAPLAGVGACARCSRRSPCWCGAQAGCRGGAAWPAWQRGILVALRALALLLLLGILMRPVHVAPDPAARETIAVLVDVSRSMALDDADGRSRLEGATRLVRDSIIPALSPRFAVDLLAFGDELDPVSIDQLTQRQASAPATDIEQAVEGVAPAPSTSRAASSSCPTGDSCCRTRCRRRRDLPCRSTRSASARRADCATSKSVSSRPATRPCPVPRST